MDTTDERLLRLEAVYEHLATKADLEQLLCELYHEIDDLRSRLIMWMVGLLFVAVTVVLAALALAVGVLVKLFVDG